MRHARTKYMHKFELIAHNVKNMVCGFIVFFLSCLTSLKSIQWRHNESGGVSNHRRLNCVLIPLFRRISKKTPKLHITDLCEGNPSVTGGFPSQRASNAEIFPFDDVTCCVSIFRKRRVFLLLHAGIVACNYWQDRPWISPWMKLIVRYHF